MMKKKFGFLVVGFLGLLFLGSSTFAQFTEVDTGSIILQMDFANIEDLAGKQNLTVVGPSRQIVDGVCGVGNVCYNIGNTGNEVIEIGDTLLSDNQNWTIAFDGNIPTESSGKDVFFVSQYSSIDIGRFSIGRGVTGNKYRVKLGIVSAESSSEFTQFDVWQHWVLSKNGDQYLLTVDGMELVNTGLDQPIQQTGTVIGVKGLISQGTGYIDNLYIFDEAYTYNEVRNFIAGSTYQLSLSSPKSYQLFQRDENDQASILISGIVSGVTGLVTLEMSYKNGPRNTITTTSGSFSISFTGNVGQGDLRVRIAEATGVMQTINSVGIGDIYLLIGQSNQDGRGDNKNTVQLISGMMGVMYRNGSRQIDNDPTGSQDKGSPRPLVANQLITETGIPIGWIPKAQGGSSASARQKGQTLYTNAINAVNGATNGNSKIKGVLWHQGESDSGKTKERYYNTMSGIVNNLYNDVNFEKFMVAIVSTPENGDGGGNADGPQQAQYQTIETISFTVQGPELYDISFQPINEEHYRSNIQIGELARRRVKHMMKEFYGESYDYPKIFGRYKYTNDTIALVLNQPAEVSNFTGEIATKAEGFNIVNSGNIIASGAIQNYSTSFAYENGRDLLLIKLDSGEVNENDVQMTYAKTNDGYNKNVLRSVDTKLSFNRNFDIQQIIPLSISVPNLTTSKTYDGTTAATVIVGMLSGVVSGDEVSGIAIAKYDTVSIGTNKTITVTYTLTGRDAGKYLPPVHYIVTNGVITAVNNPTSPSGGGGGGGGSSVVKDVCPNGDFSLSYYDGTCGNTPTTGTGFALSNTNESPQSDNTKPLDEKPASQADNASIVPTTHNEIQTAYDWAFQHSITTLSPIETSHPTGTVIRGHLAKMVVNYALNVLGRTLPKTIPTHCHWKDGNNAWENEEIKDYAIKACSFGLMGIDMDYFQPLLVVTRAQFGTILSRLLYGETFNGGNPYYINHLQALQKSGIMTQIDNPEQRKELRQRVRLMLMRSNESKR